MNRTAFRTSLALLFGLGLIPVIVAAQEQAAQEQERRRRRRRVHCER